MKWLLFNLIAAAIGTRVFGQFSDIQLDKPLFFIAAYTAVFALIWLSSFVFNRRYFFKLPKLVRYTLFIIKELFTSNFRVAYDVLTPVHHMNPAIIAIPLDAKTDREIVLLATLITFTPGTLSLFISDDKKTLYVHEMYIKGNDVEPVKKKLKEGFEKKLLELTR